MRRKRTPWPRWAKCLRNLTAALLLLAAAWEALDMPLPAGAEFRRLERQSLAPPSEIAAVIPTGEPFSPRIWLGFGEGWAIAGTPYRLSRTLSDSRIYPLSGGPELICLGRGVVRHDKTGQPLAHAVYATLQPPADSMRAVLTLRNADGDFTAEGVREGGLFLFRLRPEGRAAMHGFWFSPDGYSYELTFYNGDGMMLESAAAGFFTG